MLEHVAKYLAAVNTVQTINSGAAKIAVKQRINQRVGRRVVGTTLRRHRIEHMQAPAIAMSTDFFAVEKHLTEFDCSIT